MLLRMMLVYGATSLLHFVHNAVYVRNYPNLPPWLTSAGVCAAWLLVAATGTAGEDTGLTRATRAARFR